MPANKAARKRSWRKTSAKVSKRTRITPEQGGNRFLRRDKKSRFTKDQVNVGPSPAGDHRSHGEKDGAEKPKGSRRHHVVCAVAARRKKRTARMLHSISPMEWRPALRLPGVGTQWQYELKLDGCRAIALWNT